MRRCVWRSAHTHTHTLVFNTIRASFATPYTHRMRLCERDINLFLFLHIINSPFGPKRAHYNYPSPPACIYLNCYLLPHKTRLGTHIDGTTNNIFVTFEVAMMQMQEIFTRFSFSTFRCEWRKNERLLLMNSESNNSRINGIERWKQNNNDPK